LIRQSFLQKITAALTFDSLTIAPAYGVRSGMSEWRQLLYSAENKDLDLRIRREEDKWVVMGQVLGKDITEGTIEIIGNGRSSSSELNDQCQFVLLGMPAGHYSLFRSLLTLIVFVRRANRDFGSCSAVLAALPFFPI
jgi:hypothetical protein